MPMTERRVHALVRQAKLRADRSLVRLEAKHVSIDPHTGVRRVTPKWWHAQSVVEILHSAIVAGHTAA